MLKIPLFTKSHRRTQSGRKQLDISLDVEALTNDEKLSRSLHSIGLKRRMSSTAADRPKLFEWFLVIGVPPTVKSVKSKSSESGTTTTTTTISGTNTPKPALVRSAAIPTNSDTTTVLYKEKPKILYQYPPDKPLDNISVEYFPFPNGIPVTSINQTASHTNFFQTVIPQKHLKQPEDSFIFMLTDEKKQIMYGVCTRKISTIGSLKNDDSYQIDIGEYPESEDFDVQIGEAIFTAPKCFCILTRYPFFPLHFDIIKEVLAIQHIQEITRFHNLMSSNKKPPPKLSGSIQVSDGMITTERFDKGVPNYKEEERILRDKLLGDEKPICKLIEHIYQENVPLPGERVSVDLNAIYPQYNGQIEWTRKLLVNKEDPTSDYREYMLNYGLFVTFQLLTHKTVVIILNALLLEKKVVFYSKTPRVLTCTIFSFISLLKPFNYQSVILPLLPNSVSSLSIQDLLTAPVPYVIGLTTIPSDVDLSDIVLVDIDQNKIISRSMVDLFPRWIELGNPLILASNKLKNTMPSKSPVSFNATKEQEEIVNTAASAIESFLTKLFENFHRHCIRNVTEQKTISIFLKESFSKIEFHESVEQAWIEQFMETLTFSVYLDQRLREKDNDLIQELEEDTQNLSLKVPNHSN